MLALVVAACADEHPGHGVNGSPDDVRTPPGNYDGYRFVMPCEKPSTQIGVVGTGTIDLETVDEIATAGRDLHASLADFASIWGGGGVGLVCEPGIGTQIALDDWRDVDRLVARIGAWLREHDYKLQVSIVVGGAPVPH